MYNQPYKKKTKIKIKIKKKIVPKNNKNNPNYTIRKLLITKIQI